MASKVKEPLRREHFTDKQWEAFCHAMETMAKMKRRVIARRLAADTKKD